MKSKILLDSDFIIALIKEDDSNNVQAVRKLQRFSSSLFYVSSYVIPEVATVLSSKVSQSYAQAFLKEARGAYLELESATHELVHKTDQLFIQQIIKKTSWIDCHNVVCVSEFQLDGILSFDSFYKKAGVKML